MCYYHRDENRGIDWLKSGKAYSIPCVVFFFLILTLMGSLPFIGPWNGCEADHAQCTVLKSDQELNQCLVQIEFRNTNFTRVSSFCHKFVCPERNQTMDCYLNSDYCLNLECPETHNLITGGVIILFGICMSGCLCFLGCHFLEDPRSPNRSVWRRRSHRHPETLLGDFESRFPK